MLYYNFANYEEFKELFGIVEHGNGVKSRKNKILLALYKDRQALRTHIRAISYEVCHNLQSKYTVKIDKADSDKNWRKYRLTRTHYRDAKYKYEDDHRHDLLYNTSLPTLKTHLLKLLGDFDLFDRPERYALFLKGRSYYSDQFCTDDFNGLCEDGTINAIRYRNVEKDRTFKMKAGKMFNHILACNRLTASLPEQIQRWLSEEWVADWIEYARQNLQDTNCVLHVDDNFSDIYDSRCCAGYDEDSNSFGSCMVGDEQWTFYRDAVDAKAAYLTLADGMIVARCIVFTNVTDQDGGKWRLAERQYSMFQEPALQRQLIAALIRDGHIDGYKTVGASCGDARKFVDCQGNSLEKMRFSIPCHLEDGDTISYQDSFKWFDYETQVATNYGEGDTDLSTTDFAVSIDIHENDC